VTVVVHFHQLVVEGLVAEHNKRVVAPGAITSAAARCPVVLDGPAGDVEIGTMTVLNRVPAEVVLDHQGRYASVTWVWQGWAQLPGRSRDEVECLIRDYRPQGWIVGEDRAVPGDDDHRIMLNGVFTQVKLVPGVVEAPLWSIVDPDPASPWASGAFPVQTWLPGSFPLLPPEGPPQDV
jgi:hypothetical protein